MAERCSWEIVGRVGLVSVGPDVLAGVPAAGFDVLAADTALAAVVDIVLVADIVPDYLLVVEAGFERAGPGVEEFVDLRLQPRQQFSFEARLVCN